jgi:hypothetical protein
MSGSKHDMSGRLLMFRGSLHLGNVTFFGTAVDTARAKVAVRDVSRNDQRGAANHKGRIRQRLRIREFPGDDADHAGAE